MVCKKPWMKKCIKCKRKDCVYEISQYFFQAIKGDEKNESKRNG